MPKPEFTFIELFAGIGGFRLGLSSAGGRAVFTNEWDKHAATTYRRWYGDDNVSTDDIRTLDPSRDIPSHDVLSAGFPCQPFSIAGVSKKKSLGRAHGFSDLQQGNLFFSICDVVAEKNPKIIFLENVKNLIGHDRGKTWAVIMDSFDVLGYDVRYQVINAAAWVPQNRNRVFIVAFRRDLFDCKTVKLFKFPNGNMKNRKTLVSVLDGKPPNIKYMLTDNLWTYLQSYADKHKKLGNGFGFKLYGPDDVSGTLSARYYKDGAEVLIRQDGWRNPRRLTPGEAAKLMGFTSAISRVVGIRGEFPQVVSDMQAYKQFGNSVCPLVVADIARQISKVLVNS